MVTIPDYFITVGTVVVALFLRFTAFPKLLNWLSFRKKLTEEERDSFDSKLVASIHALTLAFCGVYTGLTSEKYWKDFDVRHTSKNIEYMAYFSIGYYLYDSIFLLSNYWKNKIFIVHHAVAITAEIVLIKTEIFHVGFVAASFMEFCNFNVHSITYLQRLGLRQSKIFVINGIVLALSWTVFRILIGVFFFQYLLIIRFSELVEHIGYSGFAVWQVMFSAIAFLNLSWYRKIMSGLVKVVQGKKVNIETKTLSAIRVKQGLKTILTPLTPSRTKFKNPFPDDNEKKDDKDD